MPYIMKRYNGLSYKYRGEGNSNIVLSLPKQRQILRIAKIKKSKFGWFIDWLIELFHWYFSGIINNSNEMHYLKFHNLIMRPLIGEKFVCEGQEATIERLILKRIEKEIENMRPVKRRFKKLQIGRGAIFHDYAFMPYNRNYPFNLNENTFAIEIKPKQGFIHITNKDSPKCTFCVNQYCHTNKFPLQLHNAQIDSLSDYCPINLFSGEEDKMMKAITSLLITPQNNLQIFKNGSYYFGEKSKEFLNECIQDLFEENKYSLERLTTEFCKLVVKILLTPIQTYDNCDCNPYCQMLEIKTINSKLNNQLPKGCVLERILSLQQLDLEGTQYYYSKIEPDTPSDTLYVDQLLDTLSKCEKSCSFQNILEISKQHTFLPYLISAVAKDCSLMITLQKIESDIGDLDYTDIIRTPIGHFVYNVGVFDLYPKSITTINNHYQRFKNGLKLFTEQENMQK